MDKFKNQSIEEFKNYHFIDYDREDLEEIAKNLDVAVVSNMNSDVIANLIVGKVESEASVSENVCKKCLQFLQQYDKSLPASRKLALYNAALENCSKCKDELKGKCLKGEEVDKGTSIDEVLERIRKVGFESKEMKYLSSYIKSLAKQKIGEKEETITETIEPIGGGKHKDEKTHYDKLKNYYVGAFMRTSWNLARKLDITKFTKEELESFSRSKPKEPIRLYRGLKIDQGNAFILRSIVESKKYSDEAIHSWSKHAEGALSYAQGGVVITRVFEPREIFADLTKYDESNIKKEVLVLPGNYDVEIKNISSGASKFLYGLSRKEVMNNEIIVNLPFLIPFLGRKVFGKNINRISEDFVSYTGNVLEMKTFELKLFGYNIQMINKIMEKSKMINNFLVAFISMCSDLYNIDRKELYEVLKFLYRTEIKSESLVFELDIKDSFLWNFDNYIGISEYLGEKSFPQYTRLCSTLKDELKRERREAMENVKKGENRYTLYRSEKGKEKYYVNGFSDFLFEIANKNRNMTRNYYSGKEPPAGYKHYSKLVEPLNFIFCDYYSYSETPIFGDEIFSLVEYTGNLTNRTRYYFVDKDGKVKVKGSSKGSNCIILYKYCIRYDG